MTPSRASGNPMKPPNEAHQMKYKTFTPNAENDMHQIITIGEAAKLIH